MRGDSLALDPRRQADVLRYLGEGLTLTIAASRAGTSRWAVWRLAQQDDDFAEALAKAEASRQAWLLHRVRDKADQDWRAASWLLSTTAPEFRQHEEAGAQVQRSLEQLLEAVRGHMSAAAYAELLDAIDAIRADDAPKQLTG